MEKSLGLLRTIYRLPWSIQDSIIAWYEPTKNCNMHCPGCYSLNADGAHKRLEQIGSELEKMRSAIKADVLAIGGGEPLTHPEIARIVALAAAKGFKPFISTNGLLVTPAVLAALKKAGLKGVNYHIDSLQDRPGWEGKNEEQLNELRGHYAGMTAAQGGLSCYFNSTVTGETAAFIPAVLEWGRRNPGLAHLLLFIAFRRPAVPESSAAAADPVFRETDIPSMLEIAVKADPALAPCAYIDSGSAPGVIKWLASFRVCCASRSFGSLGPVFIEAFQALYHLFRGRYPGRVHPVLQARGLLITLLAASFDSPARSTLAAFLRECSLRPGTVLRPIAVQPVLFIQPVTLVKNGTPRFFI